MSKRFTSILLFVVLINGYALTAPILCGDYINQTACVPPKSHPMTVRPTAAMSCCQHVASHLAVKPVMETRGCCRLSSPPLTEPRPAVLGDSGVEFKWNSLYQVSAPTIAFSTDFKSLPASCLLTIAFCLDHSDTYLVSSTFRI